jgi:hypothetical protein
MQILNLTVKIPWVSIEPGMSFFIPCLDTEKAAADIKWEADRFRYKVVCKQVIEDGKYGLRCWRVE